MTECTVRAATAADVPVLAELSWRFRTEGRDPEGADREAYLAYFAGWVLDHLTTHLPFVAEVDGAIVGMAWLMPADRVPSPTNRTRRTGDVQSVYVVPECRDRAIGSVLLAALLDTARSLRLERVTVHSSARAVTFYRRQGFRSEDALLHWQRSSTP
jgi:GNAT superfamily N-acetyltransferase